jgi:hypothetical protein
MVPPLKGCIEQYSILDKNSSSEKHQTEGRFTVEEHAGS